MTKRIFAASLVSVILILSIPGAQAAPSADARIAQ